MKIFFFCVLLMNAFSYAGSAQENFLQGCDAYQHHDYKRALNLFESVPNKGWATWYNLGNSYYKTDQFLDAMICWKRAYRYGGLSYAHQINHNYAQAASKIGVQPVQQTMRDYGNAALERIPLIILQLLFLFVCYGAALIVGNLALTRRYSTMVLMMLFVVFLGIILSLHMQYTQRTLGIVRESIDLFAGTDKKFTVRGTALRGQDVEVTDKRDGWYHIAFADKQGWVPSDYVECI